MVEDRSAFETYFQAFCAPGEQELILIPVVRHPILNELYVLWCDITTCFPRATRVQYTNVFVPMLKDDRLYRVKPHGIRHHPDIVLDVIYGDWVPRKVLKQKRRGVVQGTVGSDTIHTANDGGGNGDAVDGEGGETLDLLDSASVATHPCADDTLSIDGGDIIGRSDWTGQRQLVEERSVQASVQEANISSHSASISDEDLEAAGIDGAVGEAGVEVEVEVEVKAKVEAKVKAKPEMEAEAKVEAGHPVHTGNNATPIQLPTSITKKAPETGHPFPTTTPGKEGVPKPPTASKPAAFKPEATEPPTTMSIQEGHLRITEVVANRVKDILNTQNSWWNSYPKYFCFLPMLATITGTTASEDTLDKISDTTVFQLCNYCDCGDVASQKDPSHWTFGNSHTDVPQEHLASIIPLVGEFIVAVLEMIKYGVVAADVIGLFPNQPSIFIVASPWQSGSSS